MADIGIVGMGTVGKATSNLFKQLGHRVLSHDITHQSEKAEFTAICRYSEIVFICTHEQVVKEVLERLSAEGYRDQGIKVIRSTTVPSMVNYEGRMAHNPEFLREKEAYEKPKYVIIGTESSFVASRLTELYSPLNIPIYVMKPVESEMLKLWFNAKLSCSISFANEMGRLCDHVGANGHLINNILNRIQLESHKYHPSFIGQKFGGKCLPKDLDSLLKLSEKHLCDSKLLRAIKEVNEM